MSNGVFLERVERDNGTADGAGLRVFLGFMFLLRVAFFCIIDQHHNGPGGPGSLSHTIITGVDYRIWREG